MKSKALLELLSDGQVHSGEFLATHLGVSRTAIWKQIRRAKAEGIEIATIRGRGYQLVSRVDLLDRDSVLQCLEPWRREALSLNVLDEVDSTNAEVIRQIAAGAGKILVAIADSPSYSIAIRIYSLYGYIRR